MKLLIRTDKNIKKYLPKDIRRVIGSIVDDKHKQIALWHENKPPHLIYVKPFAEGFEIVAYTKEGINVLNDIKEKIDNKKFKHIYDSQIKSCRFKLEEYTIPQQDGLYFYITRTPIILSVNPIEYKIVYATNTTNNIKDLNRYIKRRIIKDIEFKLKYYLGIDYELNDLEIIFKREDIRLVEVKENAKKRQTVFLKFATNYSLPRFVGYSTGLGWGELINKKF